MYTRTTRMLLADKGYIFLNRLINLKRGWWKKDYKHVDEFDQN